MQLLQFTRDGRTLVVGDPDAVTLVELRGDQRRRIPVTDVQAVAAFSDQVWVATRVGVLLRLALDGRVLGEHPLPVDPAARLVAAPVGPAAALWTAAAPVMLVDDLGTLATLSAEADALAPVAGRRYVRGARHQLRLPSGAVCGLLEGSRLIAAAVLFDGSSVAGIVERIGSREVVVIALSSGRIVQCAALPPGPLAIAARRGIAVVREAADRIAVIDLRFGRTLGTASIDGDTTAIAIDPDGTLLVLRSARGDLELAPLAELLAAPVRASVEDAAAVAVAPAPRLIETAPVITPPDPDRGWDRLEVRSLVPRPARERASRREALAELDREVRSVTLWTLRAIADAWDTRRLGYGNEGTHPYEHEVAALVGMNGGFAPDYIAASRDALVAHEQELAGIPEHRGPAMPLAELADELGLSPIALDILLVIAAPAIHGEVARLYGVLANDPGRALVDQLLVEQILAGRFNRHDVAAELHPRAPLVALGIVETRSSRPRPFTGLEVDAVILARLRGESPELGAAPVVRTADRELAELELARGVVAAAVDAFARAGRPARISVRGRAGTGRRALLAAIAAQANRALGVIDTAQLPREADQFARALQLALRRAQLAGLVPVVRGIDEVVFDERHGADLAHDVFAAHPGPIAVISPPGVNPPFPVGHVVIDLPALSEGERAAVWQRALASTAFWLRDAAGLAARYRVGPGIIRRAIASLAGLAPTTPADDRIDAFLRQSRDVRLADHARRVDRLATWDDLVLPSDIMDSLRELIGRVRHRRTVFEDWGMSRTMATSRGLTALFQGQPGTGKTLVAGVVARELGLDLYQVDLSKIMSKWIGETERNLATIFDAAEDGQVILLFDEADSLFAKRTEVRSSNDRYANLEVNYLLQRLDSFEGIAILTTNSGGSIDPAFKRRLSFRLSFPFPDEDTRAELWRTHLPRELPRGGDLVFDALARKYQISGGYIRNACLRAAFLAAQEETSLHQHHLDRAVALEFAELGKLSTGGTID